MAYARLPDTFPFAIETMSAGNAATGALCRYMAWSAGNRTDGFVPDGIAEIVGNKKERDALATLGLLEPVVFGEVRIATGRISKKADVRVVMPADGYWMPQYHVYNISALEDEAASEKGRKGGLASAEARTPEPQRGEPPVEPQVEPTVEPTGQDKTRHQDRTRNQANPAVKDDKKRDAAADDSEEGHRIAPTDEVVVAGQNDARDDDNAVLDALDFEEITETVWRP